MEPRVKVEPKKDAKKTAGQARAQAGAAVFRRRDPELASPEDMAHESLGRKGLERELEDKMRGY